MVHRPRVAIAPGLCKRGSGIGYATCLRFFEIIDRDSCRIFARLYHNMISSVSKLRVRIAIVCSPFYKVKRLRREFENAMPRVEHAQEINAFRLAFRTAVGKGVFNYFVITAVFHKPAIIGGNAQ